MDPQQQAAAWHEKLEAARRLRSAQEREVWQPLYSLWQGRRKFSGEAEPIYANGADELLDTLLPQLIGEQRTVRVRPIRVLPGEDASAKLAWAELAGDQATALGRALGLYRDEQGRPGEFARFVMNATWSLGVLLFGFELPRGQVPAQRKGAQDGEQESEPEIVDLDFAVAGHRELHDAGMPAARCVDARDFLADPTFGDFGRGQWCAVEYYLTLAEAEARWPKIANRLTATHRSAPTWESQEPTEGLSGERKLVRCIDVYTRRPREVLSLLDKDSGVDGLVERREYDLGIEGLPVLLLGWKWIERECYPIPLLARVYDPASAENEHLRTIQAAAVKLRSGILVDGARAPKLAQQLRTGDDQAVYENDGPISEEVVRTISVGALRSEHLELADKNRQAFERASGTSDFTLGRREPGDPTLGETQLRQAHISMRLQGKSDPVRAGEAEMYKRLLAVAYAKLALLHGLQLPVDETQFVAFDASQPAVGELSDYTFEVEVSNALTTADEVNQINNLLQLFPNYVALLQAEGKAVRFAPLLEQVLEKSRVRGKEEILVDAAPAAPPDEQEQAAAGAAGAEEPPSAAPGPQDELAALWQELAELPEGDPREEGLLRRAAELVIGQESPAAARGAVAPA